MNNVLLYIGGLLVAVLAALFAVPHFIDWNGYRGVFEEEASRVLGREVRVGGEVNVRLLPTPYVRFGKVRIADATGGTGEPYFRADQFTLRLSVPPLLKGVLEANRIELERPALRLAADAEGRGNWTSLGLGQGSLPFAPAGVTLQSVRITDGTIAFAGPAGAEIARLDGIAGEVEAEALEGPYKFKGSVRWRNGERDVRLSTARPDADGTIRLKAVVASTAGNLYTLDGRVAGLGDRTQLDGEVTGRIGVDTLQLAAAPAPATAAPSPPAPASERAARSADGKGEPTIELKSTLAADLTAIRLGGITIALENMGQPQLVAGDARVTIAERPRIEIGLASRLLDLDALSRRPPTASPIDTAQALLAALMGQLPGGGSVDARFAVDQLTLGGEAVAGFRLTLARGDGPLEIRELKAGLPGASRIEISGRLDEGRSVPELDGQLLVRGASLNRFLAWAGKSPRLVEGRTDGPFLVRGQLRLSETEVRLDDASAELSGVPVSGALSHTLDKGRRRIAVELDGQQIDLAQLWPGGPDWLASLLPTLADAAKPAAAAGGGTASQASPLDTSTTDLVLRVRAAKLTTGTRRLTDVDADLSLDKGLLKLPRLKLATPEGLDVDVEGEVQDLSGTPRGVLRGVVAARSAAALETLQSALGVATGETVRREQLEGLVPLRLAGRASFGGRGARTADIDVDGLVQGGRFVGAWRLDGGWRDWRDARADMAITADSPDVDALLRYAVGAAAEAARGRKPRPGLVSFKAEGLPADGMLASASVRSAGLVLNYDGPLVLKPGLPPAIDGDLRVAADQIGEALALAGVTLAGAGAAQPVEGMLHVEAKDNVLTLSSRDLVVGTSKIGGHLILAQRTDRPSSLTASLEIADITLASLLEPLLERALPAPGGASGGFAPPAGLAGRSASSGPWPDGQLDLAVLDRVDGTVDLRFKRLRLDDGLALADGRLVARLAPGRVAIETLEGNATGGTVTATAVLSKVRGAVDLTGTLKLANLDPTFAGAAGDKPRAKAAPVTMTLDYAARALSPAALVASLGGRGQIEFAGGDIRGIAPEDVATAGAGLLTGALAPADDAFANALVEAGTRGTLRLPAARVAVELQDGVMRVAPLTAEQPPGRVTVTSTVDLNSLRFDSEWRIDVPPAAIEARLPRPPAGAVPPPRPATRNAPALPPVFVTYVGRLAEMTTIAPRLSVGALERELAVRKMERDVAELERLRLEDERRRAEEAERQRALEAERAKAAAEAAAAAAAAAAATQQGAAPGLPGVVAPPTLPAAPSTVPAPPPAAPTTAVPPPPPTAPPPPRPAARRSTPADEFLRQLNPN